MVSFVVRRIVSAVLVMFSISVMVFLIFFATPGVNPAARIAGRSASPQVLAQVTAEFGLNRPLPIRYALMMWHLYFKQDLTSYVNIGVKVIPQITGAAPVTLSLVFGAAIIWLVVGVLGGLVAAANRGKWIDPLIMFGGIAAVSIPVFWLGQLLILGFGYYLDWLPIQGMVNLRAGYTGFDHVLDVARHMILPVATLTLYNLALILRLTRGSLLEVVGQEYIKVARSKGLSENTVMVKHALRNALLPVVTVIGLEFRALIAGAVLTETVFAWPGLGRLTFDAINARDYPLLMGMFIFISLLVAIGNLVTDLLYALLDPRIRYQ